MLLHSPYSSMCDTGTGRTVERSGQALTLTRTGRMAQPVKLSRRGDAHQDAE